MLLNFSETSKQKLDEIHPALAYVFREALAYGIMDFSVTEAFRGKAEQNRFYYMVPPKTKLKWPRSKHNKKPSKAGHAVPYVNGKSSWDYRHCCVLAGIILSAAAKLAIAVRWGGNWDMDLEPMTDQEFQDLAHYELMEA